MVGIPMGTNCAPLLVDLFLYSYRNEFLDKLIEGGKRKLARKFNLLKPQNLLQLLLISIYFSSEILDDKRDAFGFHIVNFPFMSSNIPSAPAYGVYASQLIRYACCCSNYSDFLSRHRALMKRFLSQGYKVNRLSNTFKKFYGKHTDLVGQYKKNVCQMFADSVS